MWSRSRWRRWQIAVWIVLATVELCCIHAFTLRPQGFSGNIYHKPRISHRYASGLYRCSGGNYQLYAAISAHNRPATRISEQVARQRGSRALSNSFQAPPQAATATFKLRPPPGPAESRTPANSESTNNGRIAGRQSLKSTKLPPPLHKRPTRTVPAMPDKLNGRQISAAVPSPSPLFSDKPDASYRRLTFDHEPSREFFANTTFADMNLNPFIRSNLKRMGFKHPTTIQEIVIPHALEGRDGVIYAHTGTGKTVAFLAPIISNLASNSSGYPQALVLVPSRELAIQVTNVATALMQGTNLTAMALIGGANPLRQIESLRKRQPALVVATLGRLGDLAVANKKIRLGNVRSLVLDEVDQLLNDRSPKELENVLNMIPIMRNRRTSATDSKSLSQSSARPPPAKGVVLLASATADAEIVRQFAGQHLETGWTVLEATSNAEKRSLPQHVTHGLVVCEEGRRIEALRKILFAKPIPTQILVFANDVHRVEVICEQLAEAGIVSAPLTGNVTKVDRQDIMARVRDGRVSVVVSTELTARGIDLPEVSHVVNFDLPINAESYLHRAGRCGRAGRSGLIVSLASKDRQFIPVKLVKQLKTAVHLLKYHGGETWISKPINQS